MAQKTQFINNKPKAPLVAGAAPMPPWLEPIAAVCRIVYIPCLALGGALLLALGAATVIGQATKFSWYPQALSGMGFFLVTGFLSWCTVRYHRLEPGAVGLLLGLGLFFSPYGIAYLVAMGHLPQTEALVPTYKVLAQTGMILTIVAVLGLMTRYILWFIGQRHLRLQQQIASHKMGAGQPGGVGPGGIGVGAKAYEPPSYIPKCWEMSRCRKNVRVVCPNNIDKEPCWKRRCGCLCDREFATFLVETFERPESRMALQADRPAAIPGIVTMRERMKQLKRERPWISYHKLCFSCAIFLEHQEYKYRHLNWIGFPVTFAVAALLYPLYHEGYLFAASQLDRVAQRLFLVIKLPDNFHPEDSMLVDSPFEYVFLAVMIILLASFVFDFTDRCLLKWNL